VTFETAVCWKALATQAEQIAANEFGDVQKGDSMFGNDNFAARGALAAAAAALVMLTAPPAQASVRQTDTAGHMTAPAATGHKTWRSAQRSAGFRLKAPTATFGLVRTHPILVGRCNAAGQTGKREVYAQWNGSGMRYFALDQNNSGGACGNFGGARFLGTWRIRGHKARMYGFCGHQGQPSCTSKAAVLVLVWREFSRYYVVYSSHEWRRTLVAFARSLKFV
jgi:hypothetical protein